MQAEPSQKRRDRVFGGRSTTHAKHVVGQRRAEPSLVRFGELLGGLTDRDERGEENRRSSVLERGSDADGEVTRAHRLGRMRLDLELPERSTRLGQRTLSRAFSFALVTFGLEHERHGGDRVPWDRAQREMEGDAWKLRN